MNRTQRRLKYGLTAIYLTHEQVAAQQLELELEKPEPRKESK